MQRSDIQGRKEQVLERSSEVVGRARKGATSMIDQRRIQAAETLGSMAGALRRSGEQLGGEDEKASRYLEFAARQVESLSGSLRRIDTDQLVERMERFARRRPEVFIGGAFALGFLLSRFIKSGRPEGVYEGYEGESEQERLRRRSSRDWGGYRPATGWSAAEPSPEPVRRPTETAPGVGPT